MKLSNVEKETIIRYDDSDSTATIYTCNNRPKAKLDKLSSERTEITVVTEDDYSRTYNLPKNWIKVRAPRILTDEQRLKLSNNAKALWNRENTNRYEKS